MPKKKRKFKGRKPKPRDPFWIHFWEHVTAKNKEAFYKKYYEDKKKGLTTTGWELEYPIFLWSEKLKEALIAYPGKSQ